MNAIDDDVTDMAALDRDRLDAWPAFAESVRKRLEAGRAAYGDKSFERPPAELITELQQEALDLAGWGLRALVQARSHARADE